MSDELNPAAAFVTRRTVIRTAAITAAVAGTGLASACATGGGGGTPGGDAGGTEEKTAENPFGVDKSKPLEVVIFNGGYGDQYGTEHVALYNKWAGGDVAKMVSTTKIATELQPRFSGGNPPEVIDNAGADAMPTSALVAQNQLADMTVLLDAPTIDDPNTKIRDYLLPGTEEIGSYDGVMRALNYIFSMWGWWYSSKLFDEKGWQIAKTWDEFLALCDTIKGTGLAPIIHTGVHTQYMTAMLTSTAIKNGGLDIMLKIDNLADDAWTNDSVLMAAKEYQELYDKGFIFNGSEGMDHTTSQAEWLNGRGALLPCGSWLENEMKGKVPDGFDMKTFPTPSSPGDQLPFEALHGGAGEPFIVAEQSANKPGGMEYLRMMLSKEATTQFANLTGNLCAVKGAGDNLTDPSTALKSVADWVSAAGENVFYPLAFTWYAALKDGQKDPMRALLNGSMKAEQYCETMQGVSDSVKNDPKITKFNRTA
ncbi:N-acetylglucosamine/diacetylchitobiose ABC transporter substrate-binding protein [Naumannella cuiyingiana]|uniref:N-acetylglucosamine transport system substrate-binding protein n=1 Tax=Naumannella cuiyingiana TaxID=1347891 RepID=A0A7Z0D7K1_9ACTN|nr:N-acetylglucosamine/diacetylchitobiose ABC transporter substrate-binding protein [Naumannella cuiyingiana]NYI70358.1 N-acetylglucosamine transport system substrate-binding protein [Naumannella cuiyingiana]